MLRKMRAGGRTLLPLSVIQRPGHRHDRVPHARRGPGGVPPPGQPDQAAARPCRSGPTADPGRSGDLRCGRRHGGRPNWLVYAHGVRKHIDQARAQQARQPDRERATGRTASTVSLRTDLEVSRAEARVLREDRDKLRAALQRHLGHQLDHAATKDLVTRIDELTDHNRDLSGRLNRSEQDNRGLRQRLQEAKENLAAVRAGLCRMIRDESRTSDP